MLKCIVIKCIVIKCILKYINIINCKVHYFRGRIYPIFVSPVEELRRDDNTKLSFDFTHAQNYK